MNSTKNTFIIIALAAASMLFLTQCSSITGPETFSLSSADVEQRADI